MILKIYGRRTTRIINLEKSFFTTQQTIRKNKKINLTPMKKAEDLSFDIMGGEYIGYVLEENGTILQDTRGNRPARREFSSSLSETISRELKT